MKQIIFLLSLCLITTSQALSQTKISDMPSATTLDGTEIAPIVQNGTNKKATINLIAPVRSVFGRTGSITASGSDYSSYYPSLSGSYANPSWITSLAWSKITGTPTTLTNSAAANEVMKSDGTNAVGTGLLSPATGVLATTNDMTLSSYDTDGIIQSARKHSFLGSSTQASIGLTNMSGDPTDLTNGDIWYNASTGKFRGRQAGSSINLGLVIGSDVQAYDAELAALAGLTSAADRVPYFTGSGTASLATFSSFGRSLVDDTDASTARTTLGLAIGSNVQAYDADLTGLAGLSTNGFISRSGGVYNTRTISQGANISVTNGDGTTGNPTISVSGFIPITNGGTGSGTVEDARVNLGLDIGSDVQAWHQNLSSIANLSDPNADRIMFWDDSAGDFKWLTPGTNISISGTTLNAIGGVGGTTGSADNAILRADGTGGSTVQGSGIYITDDGRIYGTALHNNAGSITGTTNQYIASGTYTPSISHISNISSSTALACSFMRVGNVVTVSGHCVFNLSNSTVGTFTSAVLSIPVTSAFTNAENAAGSGSTAVGVSDDDGKPVKIQATAPNEVNLVFAANGNSSTRVSFSFTYLVL